LNFYLHDAMPYVAPLLIILRVKRDLLILDILSDD
jgi:hypothetical protein